VKIGRLLSRFGSPFIKERLSMKLSKIIQMVLCGIILADVIPDEQIVYVQFFLILLIAAGR